MVEIASTTAQALLVQHPASCLIGWSPNYQTTEVPDRQTDAMDQYEDNTHPFIIKIWLEESAEAGGQAIWRGYITHVPSGRRRYLKNLDDIAVFVSPYLMAMGVKLGMVWQVRRWLRSLKMRLGPNSRSDSG